MQLRSRVCSRRDLLVSISPLAHISCSFLPLLISLVEESFRDVSLEIARLSRRSESENLTRFRECMCARAQAKSATNAETFADEPSVGRINNGNPPVHEGGTSERRRRNRALSRARGCPATCPLLHFSLRRFLAATEIQLLPRERE